MCLPTPAPHGAGSVAGLIPTPRAVTSSAGEASFGSVSVEAEPGCGTAADRLAGLPGDRWPDMAALATGTLQRSPGELPVLSVVVGIDPDGRAWREFAEAAPDAVGDRPPEGYHLVVDGPDGSPRAVVAGSDPAGAFYGVQTLLSLMAGDGDGRRVPRVAIHDRPDLPVRGTIEGFYGPPWSHADRLAHLRFAGRHKFNTYVYAPKDDPFHRQRWREPYPDDELARLGELVALAERMHVRFVFSISPGLSMVYSDQAELDLLIDKLEQVWQVGVRDVALLFDDIPPELANDADVQAFGSEPGSSARAHAVVCRQVTDQFLEPRRAERPLIMVPTDYAGTELSPYRDRLAAELPADVLVWWTGHDVVVGDVTREHVDAAAGSYRHRLLLWDNFPVNDFDFSRLFLGPLTGRTTELAGTELAGITANPMPHEAASEIALATVADWAWNLTAYDPESSHRRALDSVGASPAVRTLAETCGTWPPSAPKSPRLSAWIETVLGDGDGADDAEHRAAVDGLREAFETMVAGGPSSPEASASGERAGRLEREVEPWLRAQAAMGRAGLAGLDVLASPAPVTREVAARALAEAEAHEQNVLKDVIPPFVQQVLAAPE